LHDDALGPQRERNARSLRPDVHERASDPLIAKYSRRAIDVVAAAPVVEMLGAFQDWLHQRGEVPLMEHWLSGPGRFTAEDHAFVRSSGIRMFALGELTTDRPGTLKLLERWNAFIASNADHLERIDTPAQLRRLSSTSRVGVMLSLQDSKHFESVDDVDVFHALGQRVSQVTYNGSNRLGHGSFVPDDTGLTSYGSEIVARMNHAGMAVDLSHCGDRTTLDAIAASRVPVLVTHASCRALIPGYPRAKTDEAIRKVAERGGVIGVPMLRFMLRNAEPVTIDHFLDHVDHLANLVGIEHVGIGSDQGLVTEDDEPLAERRRRLEAAPAEYRVHGGPDWLIGVEGLNHALRTYVVTEGLLRRGYSEANVALVLGGNFVRVLCEIFTRTSRAPLHTARRDRD
jgi:membrane dipeptidase